MSQSENEDMRYNCNSETDSEAGSDIDSETDFEKD